MSARDQDPRPTRRRPEHDTDEEALALLYDLDPEEAAGLAAYKRAKQQGRGDP